MSGQPKRETNESSAILERSIAPLKPETAQNRKTANKHTGARATPKTKALITEALAQGESVYSIARRLKVSMNTIVALKDTLWTKVENRRERIIAQAERNAELAAEQLTDHLQNKRLAVNQLVPIFGVNVDKLASLRGDPTLVNVEHRHVHSISADVYESLATLAQRLNDKAPRKIEAITVEPTTTQDAQRNPKPSPSTPTEPLNQEEEGKK